MPWWSWGHRQPSASTTYTTSTARPDQGSIKGGSSIISRSSQLSTCTSTSTVSSHLNADDSSFEVLPVAVGVVIFILLIIAVIIIVILYKRGRFERLFAKNRRRDDRPSETPSCLISNNGSHSHGGKRVPSENNSHLRDIDLPIDQTYNTANLKGATGVTDPTYNHIEHHKNNILKTDSTYNHIGDVLTFNINGNQSDTYVGRDDRSETECGSNDTYAHTTLTGNDGKGLSPEGAYSQVAARVAPDDRETRLKGSSAGNQGIYQNTDDKNYLYPHPVDSVNKTPNWDQQKKEKVSEESEHNPLFCFPVEGATGSDEGVKNQNYFVLQKVKTKI